MRTKVLSVEEYAKKIKAAWSKSVTDILETAKLCAEAQEKLTAKERKALKEKLPFGDEAFSMYVKIGSDPWFRGDEIKAKLPASYSSMYELARWSAQLREAAVETGVLYPGATRAKLEQFKEEQTESGSASPPKQKSRQSPAAVKGAGETKSQPPTKHEEQDAASEDEGREERADEGQEERVDELEEACEQDSRQQQVSVARFYFDPDFDPAARADFEERVDSLCEECGVTVKWSPQCQLAA